MSAGALVFPALAAAVPVGSVNAFVEGANPQYQHSSGSTAWFNPAMSGGFTLQVNATDASGMNRVDFPALGTNWTPSMGSSDVTAPSPYEAAYAWTAGAASPGARSATLTATNASTSTVAFTVTSDSAAPTGGSISYTNAITNMTSTSVVHTASTDAASGLASRQLQRRSAAYAGGVCGSYGAWSNVGAANPVSPYADATLSDGTCYQYQLLATDNVGNVQTISSANVLRTDMTAPMGTISGSPVGPLSGTATLTGTSADTGSGVNHVDVTYSGPASGNVCLSPASPTSWSCAWNTTALPDGTYTLQLLATDNGGNVGSPVTRVVVVSNAADSTPPTVSFAGFTELTGPAYQHAVGSTMYYNPAQTGSFSVAATASDAGSGVDRVDFPGGGTGWTPVSTVSDGIAPYTTTYTWIAGATSVGTRNLTARDVAGNTATAAFTVTADATAPTGGSISYTNGTVAGLSASVTFTNPTDTGSGLGNTAIERSSAPLSGGVCGSYGTWSAVAMSPASPYTDATLVGATCYRYRLVGTDNVGNQATFTSASVARTSAGAGLVVTRGSTSVAEGGATSTFTVALATAPSANVVVSTPTDQELDASPTALTFTTANWNTPQTVTVEAVDDDIDEASPHLGTMGLGSVSSDPSYNGLSGGSIEFDVTDNDVAGVTIAPASGLSVAEAGSTSDTFAVVLNTQPTSSVTINTAPDSQVHAAPTALTFTPMNWNVPQTVTVTAVDDLLDEANTHAGHVVMTVTSTDPTYDALVLPVVDVDVTDNDTTVVPAAVTASFGAFVEGVNPQFQHVSGRTLWFNPAASGSFEVRGSGASTDGIARLTFPVLGAGWTPGAPMAIPSAPYAVEYSWVAGAASPGTRGIVARSSLDRDSAPANFVVAADTTPPVGASVSAEDVTTNALTTAIAFTVGTDTESGVASWQLQRRVAKFGGDACAAFGTWSNFGAAGPVSPMVDQLTANACAEYRLEVRDNVGNVSYVAQGQVRADRNKPTGSIDPFESGVARGLVALQGDAVDPTTRVVRVVVTLDDAVICDVAPNIKGRWACDWNVGADTDGLRRLAATFTDVAGNVGSDGRNVLVGPPLAPDDGGPADTTEPTVELDEIEPVTWRDTLKLAGDATDDRDPATKLTFEARSALASRGGFTPWKPVAGSVAKLGAKGATWCFRAVATDAAGNVARSEQQCTTMPMDDREMSFTSAWKKVALAGAWRKAVIRTTRRNATVMAKVAEPRVTLVLQKCRGCGSVKVLHGKRVLGTYSLAPSEDDDGPRVEVALPVLKSAGVAPLAIVSTSGKPVQVDAIIAPRTPPR